jgi:alanyl-tRNA synthetase
MGLDRTTRKLYHEHPHLACAQARVIKTGADSVELSATVAFPEGGGQESDQGTLTLADGRVLRFVHAQRMYGELAGLKGFPELQVRGVIWHGIHPDDRHVLADVQPGSTVAVRIDVGRRARLTLSHTAAHLLYVAALQVRPEAEGATIGCHIREGSARLDFALRERFSAADLERIATIANALVAGDHPIELTAHADVPDARTWHCNGHAVPCGGTHLASTGAVGAITVRRKGLGTGKERLTCEFPAARVELGAYHD